MARSVVFNLIGNNRTSSAFRGAADDADRAADRIDRLGGSADRTSDSFGRLGGSMRGLGKDSDRAGSRLSALAGSASTAVTALLAVGPAAGAAAAAAVAGAGAMAAAYGSAAAALGAFGLAAKGQLTGVTAVADAHKKAQDAVDKYGAGSKQATEAQKAYQQSLSKLPPATQATAKAFMGLKSDYQKWSDSLAGDTMPIFTRGLNVARGILPKLTPLVKTAAGALSDFMGSIEKGTKSKGFGAFIGRINQAAKKVLPSLLRSAKNVGVGLAGIFDAFLPHAGAMASGVEGLTAKFAAWGKSLKSSEGFKSFIDYVKANLPALKTTFGNLVQIVINLAKAFAPMSGVSLQLVKSFTAMLAALPPPVVTALAYAFVAASTAAKVWIPIQTALNVVLSANPIGLIVLAIAGLVAGLVIAYKKSETFRNIVNGVWAGVRTAVSTAWTQWIRPALSGLGSLFSKAAKVWQDKWPAMQQTLTEVSAFFRDTLSGAINTVTGAFGKLGLGADGATGKIAGVGAGFQTAQGGGAKFLSWSTLFGTVIGTVILGPLGAIIGGLTGWFWPSVRGTFVQGFKSVGATTTSSVNGLVSQAGSWMRRTHTALTSGLPPVRASWSGFWDFASAVTSRMVSLVLGKIRSFLGHTKDAFVSGVSAIGRAWGRLSDAAKRPVNFVIGIYNNGVKKLVEGLASAVGAKVSLPGIPTFARGGTLANPMPVAPMMTNGPLAIVGEGRRQHPEYVIPTDPRYRGRAQALWAAAGRDLGAPVDRKWLTGPNQLHGEGLGFARGGSLQTLAFGGIIGDFIDGVRNFTIGNVTKGAATLMDKVLGGRVPGSGAIRDVVAAVPGWIKTTVLGWVKKKVASFGGGPSMERALAWAKTQAGKPYQWGGNGNPSWDCSGFMSGIESVIRGERPHRRWATSSFNGGTPPGWHRGARSGFMIGVLDNGNAHASHTAGTLLGKNVESSGSGGVRVGGGARGAGDGMFPWHYGFKLAKGGVLSGPIRTATYDSGGLLQPGLTLAYNGTGRAEVVSKLAKGGKIKSRKDTVTIDPIARSKAGVGLLKQITSAMLSSTSKIASFFSGLVAQIKKQFSGSTEKKMLAWAASIQKAMSTAASKAAGIADKIAQAKEFAANVTSSAKDFASLSGLTARGSAKTVASGLAGRADTLQKFAGQLTQLKQRGLSSGLLSQIIAMGAGEGSGLAATLLAGTPETLKAINAAQSRIDTLAGNLGNTAANIMFDSGKNAGKGFLSGLYGQQAELNKLMDQLGKRLASGVRSGFKVSSGPRSVQDVKYGKFDSGGMLMPGWTLAHNATGKPEPVFTSTEAAAAYGAGGTGVREVHVHFDPGSIVVKERADVDLIIQQLEFRLRAAAL
ncbi:hypothetical protein [Actinomadura litoris]|uniref:hypothetical protein n=1 Tax=Actinomadura litoris TaxID=2678616 RepID=UPI001FA74FAD|nr:hypothetical protein [Actinomadura litoris]